MERAQKWHRRKDSRPQELLDAALLEFFEKGFAAARLEDIAARAGVSKGTVYLYFGSKDDIFEALVSTIPKAGVDQLTSIVTDSSVPADLMLSRVLSFIGTIIRDDRIMKFPRLVIGEAGRFPKLAESYKREVVSRGVEVIAAVIERGILEGKFLRVDAKNAAFAALSPLLFVAIWRTTFERFDPQPLDAQAFIDQHISSFLRGLIRGTQK